MHGFLIMHTRPSLFVTLSRLQLDQNIGGCNDLWIFCLVFNPKHWQVWNLLKHTLKATVICDLQQLNLFQHGWWSTYFILLLIGLLFFEACQCLSSAITATSLIGKWKNKSYYKLTDSKLKVNPSFPAQSLKPQSLARWYCLTHWTVFSHLPPGS